MNIEMVIMICSKFGGAESTGPAYQCLCMFAQFIKLNLPYVMVEATPAHGGLPGRPH
jgi:hypothetical protein